MDGSKAGGDLVLIQTFLFYYVNQDVLMLISIFKDKFDNKVNLSLTFTRRVLSPQL